MSRSVRDLPSILTEWDRVATRFAGRRPAVFLDYDGTLTPIVDRPDRARLDTGTREALRALAERHPTVIVSGRGREEVARLVGIDRLIYAGSHGFDIAGPDGSDLRHQVGSAIAPVVRLAAQELADRLGGIAGLIVEDKRFAVALHYRLVADVDLDRLTSEFDAVLAAHPELRRSSGKKVLEMRPRIDWDKGKAVLWLLEALRIDGGDLLPVYVGDDTTDEDAFEALRGRGVTVLVAAPGRPSAAGFSARDCGEVRDLLVRLTRLG